MTARFDNAGFKATARHLPEAILITDPAGRVTWANRAFKKLCGYDLKEITGQRPGTFLQGKHTDPETVHAMHAAMEQQKHFHAEVVNYHKKGHPYWAAISVTPFFDEDGSLQGHIGVAQDITKKRMEIQQMEHDLIAMYTALVSECTESADSSEADPFLVPMHFGEFSSGSEPRSAEPHRMSRL